jgi:hypothetical protein
MSDKPTSDKPMPGKAMPGTTDDHPVVLRAMSGTWWIFAVVGALCAFALARGYFSASTTGERIEAVAIMGTAILLCAWAALTMKFRRPTLTISADAITYARRSRLTAQQAASCGWWSCHHRLAGPPRPG